MTLDVYNQLATRLIKTAYQAGRVEVEIFRQEFDVKMKQDNSPVTEADRAAEKIILGDLEILAPEIPVVAEEAASDGYIPATRDRFFLVDPLDGTKEFIQKSGEFTVNIALIEHGKPVFGLVYAPISGKLYFTRDRDTAVAANMNIDLPEPDINDLDLRPIKTTPPDNNGLKIIASKSHMNADTKNYLRQFNILETKSAGSSLKFCLLAEGLADMYPRFGPTMEWDTAAGHAVLAAAGGQVVSEDGIPLLYGEKQPDFLNPNFIAWGRLP